jgi:hypothetical protein
MKTAVEWLINEIPAIDWDDPYYKLKYQESKEIEKMQIEVAYNNGFCDAVDSKKYNEDPKYKNSNEYYKETFENNESR